VLVSSKETHEPLNRLRRPVFQLEIRYFSRDLFDMAIDGIDEMWLGLGLGVGVRLSVSMKRQTPILSSIRKREIDQNNDLPFEKGMSHLCILGTIVDFSQLRL
jgi:hypothetical protein